MSEQKRCCENCGNTRCANSMIAFWWDECVETNFEKHWRPRFDVLPPLQDKEDLIQQVGEFQNYEG